MSHFHRHIQNIWISLQRYNSSVEPRGLWIGVGAPRRQAVLPVDSGRGTMNFSRRKFLHLAAGAAALPAVPRTASAQAYPARPVHVIVPYPPGGGADIHARLIGQWLSDHLGQPFVIESRPGAGTNIGTEAVVKAAPDGYTLLIFDGAATTNATLYDHLNFNFIRDIAPVAAITHGPLVMLVNAAFPAKTVPEFITYAKANPHKVNM